MDFDIGNILYVVITLVAILVGVLGKKKKRVNPSPGDSDDKAQPGFMENLERILRMGQEDPQVADLQVYEDDLVLEESEQAAASSVPSKSILDDYDRIMSSLDHDDQDTILTDGDSLSATMEGDMDPDAGPNYFDIVKDFDAGTAVVYSAIINRLDY